MGILIFRPLQGDGEISAEGDTSASLEMEENNYIFSLMLAKELLKTLSDSILEYFLEFFFFFI